jgi:hypothetical protein
MADSASLSAEQELAFAFRLWADSEDAVRALVHEGLLEIRNSRDVALARADVLIEAAEAAAEQVQDIRIELLENPQGNYTSFVIEVLVTLAFETTIAGVVLSRISKALFSHVLASTAMAMRRRARAILAPSGAARARERAKALQLLRDLPRMRGGQQRTDAVAQLTAMATTRSGKVRQLLDGFAARRAVPPAPASDSRQALKSFHEAVRQLAKGGGDMNENLQGAAQTAIVLAQAPRAATPLSNADSPGVQLLTDIQAYAGRLRLTIRLVHNQLEKWMSDQLLEPDTEGFLDILSACAYRDVRAEGDVDLRRIDDDLRSMRDQYRLLFEAVIWAHLFGFQRPRSGYQPERLQIDGEKFVNIADRLHTYWYERFGPQIDARNAEPGASFRYTGTFKDLTEREKVYKLRDYFWMIVDSANDLRRLYGSQPAPANIRTWW